MKNLLFLMVGMLTSISITAQINSNNVLEYYEMTKSASTTGVQSQILTAQIGDNNIIEVKDYNADYMAILQYGNNNVTYYENYTQSPTNMEINIKGSGNQVEVYGANSISNGMTININANDMTLYMRNQ